MAQPINKVKIGGLEIAKWENEQEKDGKKYIKDSYSLKKTYKDDKDASWKESKSFTKTDLLNIQLMIQKILIEDVKGNSPSASLRVEPLQEPKEIKIVD